MIQNIDLDHGNFPFRLPTPIPQLRLHRLPNQESIDEHGKYFPLVLRAPDNVWSITVTQICTRRSIELDTPIYSTYNTPRL